MLPKIKTRRAYINPTPERTVELSHDSYDADASSLDHLAADQAHARQSQVNETSSSLLEEQELATYLNKGWLLTKELRSGKMLIARAG